jgi:putative endonuclease
MHSVYILYSKSLEKYYIGMSEDPDKRLEFHNKGRRGWTKRGVPWEMVFQKEFPTHLEAARAERFIKRKGGGKSIYKRIMAGKDVFEQMEEVSPQDVDS